MRFVVIGCGSIGKRHIGNLLVLGHEVAGYNRGEVRRVEALDRFGIPVYDDLDVMLDEFPADAAVIATPQALHMEHSLTATQKGLHLFIEKPLSGSLEGLDMLEREVKSRGLITHIGCNMRFHFGPSTVRDRMENGFVGRPLWAFFWGGMHLPDWHPDEDYRTMYSAKVATGGGAVLDFIHELDLLLWMFGEPKRVAALTAQSGWLEIETEDMADAVLGYPDGLQVNVHLDYLQRPFQRGIRVVGDRGWVQWDLAREYVEWFVHEGGKVQGTSYPDGYEHNDMYVEQLRYFQRCIEDGVTSTSDLAAGRKALELALRIKASSDTNSFK